MKKIIATLIGTAMLLVAAPASAGDIQEPRWCEQVEPRDCPKIRAELRIAERVAGEPRFQLVTVTASNLNYEGNGALDAQLVVTYQATRLNSIARQKVVTLVSDGGGTFSATFQVRRFRDVDGLVTASIEDVRCDTVNEVVGLS